MNACPYCGERATDLAGEIAHMLSRHPEVIADRLRGIGEEPPEVESVPAEAMSAARIEEEHGTARIEVLVVVNRRPRAFTIGPIAAKTLILLLREAVEGIEGKQAGPPPPPGPGPPEPPRPPRRRPVSGLLGLGPPLPGDDHPRD